MTVTIIDVAKEANVSPSTVSRVIADSPRISEQTKRKVREVMARLDYHPNFQARNLAAKSTKTIGVIMAHSTSLAFQNPFFPEVIRGICTSAHARQYGIYLSTGGTEEEIYQEVMAMVQGRKVDGIILLYSRVNDRTMNYLKESGFPFTMVGRPYHSENEITYIDNDNKKIANDLVNYLYKLGHKQIAFIGGNLDYVVSSDRLDGYQKAISEAGFPYSDAYFIHDHVFKTKGKSGIHELMKQNTRPTAIVAHDDLVAYEVIRYLEELSIRVPEDVSIVSFNNHALSAYVKPPLTTVDISIFELGLEATNYLLEQMLDPEVEVKHHYVPTTLIERESCRRLIE
ncbi:DNA-binding LacI/PurR family transcriptional regulator [Cytobacillus eiseniae]|uniref:DNA-binding LacI/PurR family transcriptional regulator n=1 Tax=Cytobacillus eiseniae TaxID=762947 RepID=A0ABS4RKF3_9BACI|nr:LacI family DNA-binding transcriptional regulator [Cytobacillus eiseniae]MBP2242774.1 DNA-binding LacI/PurR family transcriptional regulator [Cytobacillus eiseniae]